MLTDLNRQGEGKRLGLVVGGGPAPGINGVISAVTIEAIEQGFEVIGFQDGFLHLIKNDPVFRQLTIDDVKGIHLRGGSVLGTSRTNPAKNESDLNNVITCFKKMNISNLVTIGGDDTAFSGSQVYKKGAGAIHVAHVPKTIDNDLPLPPGTPTFGFETARHVGVQIIRNLAEDARTTSRWYLMVCMGRAAGHLALGVGKAAAATLTIIPEEFKDRKVSLEEITDILAGAVIKRRAMRAPFGVAVLAEGLLESIGEEGLETMGMEKLSHYGNMERDPHGHLRLGEIEFGRMIKDRLSAVLKQLGLSVTLVDKDLGYELRCADPIPFDAEYTRDLGYGAVRFLLSPESNKYGAVISIVGGTLKPLPFESMINPATKRMQNRKVDINGEGYECARRYMIRLNESDFLDPVRLNRLADTVKMTPEQFLARFGYLIKHH